MEAKWTHSDPKASQCPIIILPLRHMSPLNPQWDICGHHYSSVMWGPHITVQTLNRTLGLGIRHSYFLSAAVSTRTILQSLFRVAQIHGVFPWYPGRTGVTGNLLFLGLFPVHSWCLANVKCTWREQINLIWNGQFSKAHREVAASVGITH